MKLEQLILNNNKKKLLWIPRRLIIFVLIVFFIAWCIVSSKWGISHGDAINPIFAINLIFLLIILFFSFIFPLLSGVGLLIYAIYIICRWGGLFYAYIPMSLLILAGILLVIFSFVRK